MGFFDLGRKEGFPTQYPTAKTPVTVDVLETGLVLAFVIVGVAFLIIVHGLSVKKSTNSIIRIMCSLTIGGCLIAANYGQEWEVGTVENTKAPYRAGSPHEINATVGLKLGLRSVNVTLKGNGFPATPLENETINYNERFWWTWDQGRFGFGPYAGLIQRNFREAQRTGLPIPILSVIEYFVIDGEGWRYGRFYRTAGWYTHILMWTAFVTWVLTNIFLNTVARYSAYYLALTGGLQILACIVWACVRNPYPLVIPFERDQITTSYGVDYWRTLICGHVCLVLAVIMLLMDLRYPIELSDFLGLDIVNDYDECEIHGHECELPKRCTGRNISDIEMHSFDDCGRSEAERTMTILKRHSLNKNHQKKLYRVPLSAEASTSDPPEEETIYDRLVNRPGPSKQVQNDISESKEQLCSSSRLS